MAVNSYTLDLDNIATTTLQILRSRIADTIFKASPFAYWLLSKGRVKFENGGLWIQQPLMYGKNTTIAAYKGYDTLNVNPTEELTAARFQWRQAAGSVTISGLEELQNAGAAQLFDNLKQKLKILEMSFKEWFNEKLHAATSAKDPSRDILGLAEIVEKAAGGSQGTLGGISKVTYPWWRNQYSAPSASGVAYSTRPMTKALISFINDCSKGLSRPDLLVTTQTWYENYEKENMDLMRLAPSDQGMLNMGFQNQKFKGITMIWDENAEADTIRALNTEFMEMVIHRARNFVMTPFVKPHNQDARSAQMLFAGNMVTSNNRFHGAMLLSGITYA